MTGRTGCRSIAWGSLRFVVHLRIMTVLVTGVTLCSCAGFNDQTPSPEGRKGLGESLDMSREPLSVREEPSPNGEGFSDTGDSLSLFFPRDLAELSEDDPEWTPRKCLWNQPGDSSGQLVGAEQQGAASSINRELRSPGSTGVPKLDFKLNELLAETTARPELSSICPVSSSAEPVLGSGTLARTKDGLEGSNYALPRDVRLVRRRAPPTARTAGETVLLLWLIRRGFGLRDDDLKHYLPSHLPSHWKRHVNTESFALVASMDGVSRSDIAAALQLGAAGCRSTQAETIRTNCLRRHSELDMKLLKLIETNMLTAENMNRVLEGSHSYMWVRRRVKSEEFKEYASARGISKDDIRLAVASGVVSRSCGGGRLVGVGVDGVGGSGSGLNSAGLRRKSTGRGRRSTSATITSFPGECVCTETKPDPLSNSSTLANSSVGASIVFTHQQDLELIECIRAGKLSRAALRNCLSLSAKDIISARYRVRRPSFRRWAEMRCSVSEHAIEAAIRAGFAPGSTLHGPADPQPKC